MLDCRSVSSLLQSLLADAGYDCAVDEVRPGIPRFHCMCTPDDCVRTNWRTVASDGTGVLPG